MPNLNMTALNRHHGDQAASAKALEVALSRAQAAEAALNKRDLADQAVAIETALNRAQSEGKITPATRPSYLAICKMPGGLATFQELAAMLPQIVGSNRIVPDRPPPGSAGAGALSELELAVARALGHTPAKMNANRKDNLSC